MQTAERFSNLRKLALGAGLGLVAGGVVSVFVGREVAEKVGERQEAARTRYRKVQPDDALFGPVDAI